MIKLECQWVCMPRKSRIGAPGALYHVIGRGINRQDIFTDSKDYPTEIGDVKCN